MLRPSLFYTHFLNLFPYVISDFCYTSSTSAQFFQIFIFLPQNVFKISKCFAAIVQKLFLFMFNENYFHFLCSHQEIQSQLTNWKGPDLIGYGELVLEGTFRLQRAKNERTLFLFDKLLLITKKREETYTYKAHILVSRVSRSTTRPRAMLNTQTRLQYFQHHVLLVCCSAVT